MEKKNPLFDFYKELYFHEIDVRENLSSRVQIPLAIIVSLSGALTFMLLNFNTQINELLKNIFPILFSLSFSLSVIALSLGVAFLLKSWTGHTYSFLPTATDTEEYRKKLIETYSGFENNDELVQRYLDEYICNFYIKSSTKNTNCNDKRSLFLHKANKYLVITIVFTTFTFLFFYIGALDKTKIDSPMEINTVNSSKLRN